MTTDCMLCTCIQVLAIHQSANNNSEEEGKDYLQSGCKLKGKEMEIQSRFEPGPFKLRLDTLIPVSYWRSGIGAKTIQFQMDGTYAWGFY